MAAATLAAVTMMATSAQAAVFQFKLSGASNSSWIIDDADEPYQSNSDGVVYSGVAGIFDGGVSNADIDFFSSAKRGGLRLTDVGSGDITAWATGALLYTSTSTGISFRTGSFALSNTAGGSSTLTITNAAGAVPEPATWAMLIVGFGAVGAASRRRRAVRPAVRLAA